MKRIIDRREMLGLSSAGVVAGVAALMLPRRAIAEEVEVEIGANGITSDPNYVLINDSDYLTTGDSAVDEINQESFGLWREALIEACAAGEEVITVINPSQVSLPVSAIVGSSGVSTRGAKTALTNERSFTSGALISINYKLGLSYDVDASNQVSGFRGHAPYIMYGMNNPTLNIVGYSYTRIDAGRAYAVNTTLYVSANLLGVTSGATFQKYSEYYYSGGAYLN